MFVEKDISKLNFKHEMKKKYVEFYLKQYLDKCGEGIQISCSYRDF